MQIEFSKLSLPSAGVVVLIVSEEEKNSEQLQKFIEKAPTDFKAEFAEITPASHPKEHELDLVLLVGIGANKDITLAKSRKLGAKILSSLSSLKLKKATILLGETTNVDCSNVEIAANVAYGMALKDYKFDKYLSEEKKKKHNYLESVNIRLENSEEAMTFYQELEILKDSVFFARDLISEPANILTTEEYAKRCEKLSDIGLKIDVLGEKEMKKLNMNSLLAVGQGSAMESKLVVLEWRGDKNKDAKTLALVGKGVVFDTGGISIKPSAKMDAMKGDMGGSAAVVGAMMAIAKRKSQSNVIGVIGIVENMPSSKAQRPGDIVTSMSGQTIECLNTDAEGRMVLADALSYTKEKYQPDYMINLATLTGAIVVSLADVYAGLFSNDDELSKKLINAGEKTDEWLWRMPMHKEFDEMIDSPNADMQNIGNGRGAGSSTAAQFLKRFVGDTKWAHLDIAGTSAIDRAKDLSPKGATAFGVRLLDRLIKDNFESVSE